MLGNVDAVHGAYYLLVWPLARLFGSGELVMRLPSLLAMAIAAGAITATGRRLATPAVGLIAGMVFAAAPSVTEFGQMARSYALVTMAAAIASYALVRALADAGRAPRWVWYAVSLAVLGALNIAALLLVPAHGITVWLLRRDRAAAGSRPGRSWLIAAAIGSGLNVPLVLLAFSQRGQVKWLPPPSVADPGNALDQLGPPLMTVAIAVTALAAVAVAVSVGAGPAGLSRAGPSRLGPTAMGSRARARDRARNRTDRGALRTLAGRAAGGAVAAERPHHAAVQPALHPVLHAGRGPHDRGRAGRAGQGARSPAAGAARPGRRR